MKSIKHCFFTPSYIGDLERLLILRKSIKRFVKENLKHYVIVPKEDYTIFKEKLGEDDSVILLRQNDYVDEKFYPSNLYLLIKKYLPNQTWRFHKIAGRPGWIIQQIVKLSLPSIIEEEIAIIIDSDTFFIKDFSINNEFTHNEDIILLRRNAPYHQKHIKTARNILKIQNKNLDIDYMGCPIIWYKDLVIKLQKHIELTHKKKWQDILYKANTISEYSIYGLFVEEILKPRNIKLISKPLYIGVWTLTDFEDLLKNKVSIHDQTISLVLQSNLNIATDKYKSIVDKYLEKIIH